ncbi:MAG: pantoate--beta-alanine ligase [Candidatus Aminicenantes bacterium]|nr:pantoate--beta-alanine ligase [Candidatus Aminicenantes bacterium]
MKKITSVKEMKATARELRSRGKTIGFVPTMGYLHEGHLSLVRKSTQKAEVTVVSVFVNPAQFGPKEDFKEYPRDLNRDLRLLEKVGVDYLFYPDSEEVYPPGYRTYVRVHDLEEKLCGRSRPGFFRGVCTVVLKLFNIVEPDIAFFGQKDAQQAIILQRMVEDLHLDVKIEVLPIVRDEDGLALSSRNEYLNSKEREAALALPRSLQEAKKTIKIGERRAAVIIKKVEEMIRKEPLTKIDYVEIVDLDELKPIEMLKDGSLLALAVWVGKTRLIDNLMIEINEKRE